jgi:DNA-binding transcriptional MerR regulator
MLNSLLQWLLKDLSLSNVKHWLAKCLSTFTSKQWLAIGAMILFALLVGVFAGAWISGNSAQQRLAQRRNELAQHQDELVQRQKEREEDAATRQKEMRDRLDAIFPATPTPQSAEELAQRQARANEANRLYESIRNSGIPEDIATSRSPDSAPGAP